MLTEEESLRERGRQVIESAQGVMEDYKNALRRNDWNMAVRRAQEAVELLIKGAIYSTGTEGQKVHTLEVAGRLRKLIESDSSVLTEVEPNVPLAVRCSFADDPTSGHELQMHENTISLYRVKKESRSLVWEEALPNEREVPICVIHERNRSGYCIVEQGGQVIAIFNELGGEYLASRRLKLPIQISDAAWDLMILATDALAKQRCPAFYREVEYQEQDATEAGERMNQVYAMVKKIMGGPEFGWEPAIP